MMPAVVSALLSATALAAVWGMFWRQPARRKEALASLLVTMTGTFVGVYFAVYVADSHTVAAEKQQLALMVLQADAEIIHEQSLTTSIIELIEQAKKGEPLVPINPIRELGTLNQILANPSASKHLHLFLLDLLTLQHNLKLHAERGSEKGRG